MRFPQGFDLATARPHKGHLHAWPVDMSRRQFLGATALATGAAVSSGVWMPALVAASSVDPVPIFDKLGGTFSVQLPMAGLEPATITNLVGSVGVAHIAGTGTGRFTDTGATMTIPFDADMRFMQGSYVGSDGQRHAGTFAFV